MHSRAQECPPLAVGSRGEAHAIDHGYARRPRALVPKLLHAGRLPFEARQREARSRAPPPPPPPSPPVFSSPPPPRAPNPRGCPPFPPAGGRISGFFPSSSPDAAPPPPPRPRPHPRLRTLTPSGTLLPLRFPLASLPSPPLRRRATLTAARAAELRATRLPRSPPRTAQTLLTHVSSPLPLCHACRPRSERRKACQPRAH